MVFQKIDSVHPGTKFLSLWFDGIYTSGTSVYRGDGGITKPLMFFLGYILDINGLSTLFERSLEEFKI